MDVMSGGRMFSTCQLNYEQIGDIKNIKIEYEASLLD